MLKAKLCYLLLFVTVFVVSCFVPNIVLSAIIIIMIIAPIFIFLINLIVVFKSCIQFEIEDSVITLNNTNIGLNIILENTSSYPALCGKVKLSIRNMFMDETITEHIVFPIPTKNTIALKTELISGHCGKIIIDIQQITFYDILGLTYKKKKINKIVTVAVLPDTIPIEDIPDISTITNGDSDTYSSTKKGDDHSEVFDYHEYTLGNSMKDINWKLSSRLDNLYVKDYSLPIKSSIMILLELSTNDLTLVDFLLTGLISLSNHLYSLELSHTLTWYSPDVGLISSDIDSTQNKVEESCYDALHMLYETKLYNSNLALKSYLHTNTPRCANTFYITADLSLDVASELLLLDESQHQSSLSMTRLVIIYVNQTIPIDDGVKNMLEQNDIKIL